MCYINCPYHCLLLFMGLAASVSNAQTVDWVLPMSSVGEDMATAVGTGMDGSIYTAGSFNGTMTLGEGVGTVSLTSSGSTDAFLARYNASGELTWAFKIGGTDSDEIFDLAV